MAIYPVTSEWSSPVTVEEPSIIQIRVRPVIVAFGSDSPTGDFDGASLVPDDILVLPADTVLRFRTAFGSAEVYLSSMM